MTCPTFVGLQAPSYLHAECAVFLLALRAQDPPYSILR